MTALSPRRTFSGTALKTIACITMLVDHIGASCIEAGILTPGLDAGTLSQNTLSAYPLYRLDMVLRFTGRLAFPLFCFLLVEGFVHTHNVKGYLGRLVLFGLLSEVPFDLAFFRTPFFPGAQNVYWTLALGVLAMAGLKHFEKENGLPGWQGFVWAVQYPPCKKQYFTVILRFIPTAPFVNKDTVFPINSMSFQCPFLSLYSNTHSPSRHLKSAYRRH